MQLLLRQITYDSSGLPEYADSELTRDNIVIGRSQKSDIQLLDKGVAAEHARLTKSGDKLRLVAAKGQSFIINSKIQKQAELKPGDEIRIGAQTFICTEAPTGFDLALEWQFVEMPEGALSDAYRTSVSQLGFSPRIASWVLFVLVLLVGLSPLLSDIWQADKPAVQAANELANDNMAFHKLWLSGPLLSAHELTTGNNCTACHQTPFVQVKDNACQQCHVALGDHVMPAEHPAEIAEWVAALDEFACQNCHKEHNEPASLVARNEGLCLDCHQQMKPSVKGFSQDAHPEFALSLLRPDVTRQNGLLAIDWQLEKLRSQASDGHESRIAAVKETSHLKFPHDTHLDGEAVKHARRGDALQCADCHTLSSDREHFEPISMETSCASCHDLSFDPRTPQKQLPHGAPEEVYDALEAHFVKLAFSPDTLVGFERRRIPGRTFTEEDCDQDYACAKQQALRETGRQFSQRGCVTCHEVSEQENAEGSERWEVLPVKINHDWYADARFDHQSHLTQWDQSGDAVCSSCHSATTSAESSDILMPNIAQCVDCHDGRAQAGRVALTCISCHAYHRHSAIEGTEGIGALMQGAIHDQP